MKGVSTIEFLIIVSLILIIASVIIFIIKNQNYEGVMGEENQSIKQINNVSVNIWGGLENGHKKDIYFANNVSHILCFDSCF